MFFNISNAIGDSSKSGFPLESKGDNPSLLGYMIAIVFLKSMNLMPVSYTHLDVYKRQV